MASSVYTPPPGEYVRPAGRYFLETDPDAGLDRHFVRGSAYHQEPLARCQNGAQIVVELVPEPGNPHDPWAVAFHLTGHRIGYVASDYAEGMHEYLAGHNRQGRAVYAHGEIRVRAESKVRLATVFLPWRRHQVAFQEESGVLAECDGLIEALPADVRLKVMQASQDLPSADVRLIWAKRPLAPNLVWSKRQGHQIPTALRYRLIDWDKARREEARMVLAAEREQARQAKQQERAARQLAKTQVKVQLDESICQFAREGFSITAIAGMLGCSENRVRSALDRANVSAVNANEASRDARLSRGRRALGLQRDGATRNEIAVTLGCGLQTVKDMLKDAKFFEDPSTDPQRLERALVVGAVCSSLKPADAGVELGWTVTAVKSARSDAAVLALTNAEAW